MFFFLSKLMQYYALLDVEPHIVGINRVIVFFMHETMQILALLLTGYGPISGHKALLTK